MLRRIGRLFVITSRWEAYLIVYALALGATSRGAHYLEVYPGAWGWALFAACTGAVFLAGAKILDCLRLERERKPAGRAALDAANDRDGTRRAA
jgi:hypothetical protein